MPSYSLVVGSSICRAYADLLTCYWLNFTSSEFAPERLPTLIFNFGFAAHDLETSELEPKSRIATGLVLSSFV
ncbi:hypothetical protein RIF29_02021 [Crotalaria pallida]|uniref:Uncharacterized protein n=1 Tax=Crotalaria pallida TaxID=3830 RepID=A0AAN9P7R8_CROPI